MAHRDIYSDNSSLPSSSTYIQIQLRTYKIIEVYNLTFSVDGNKVNEVEQFCHELKHNLESKQNTQIQVFSICCGLSAKQ